MSSRDWESYKSFFIEEATLTTIWQTENDSIPGIYSVTIDEFLAQTADGPDSQPIFEEKMLEAETTVRDGLAQSWVKYEAKFGSEDNLMTWEETDLFSWIKFNDEWKIVSLAYVSY